MESGYGPELRKKFPLVAEQFCRRGGTAVAGHRAGGQCPWPAALPGLEGAVTVTLPGQPWPGSPCSQGELGQPRQRLASPHRGSGARAAQGAPDSPESQGRA